MTASELRALGNGRLRVCTADGAFTGWFDAERVSEDAVMILLHYRERGALHDGVVIDLAAITDAAVLSDERESDSDT